MRGTSNLSENVCVTCSGDAAGQRRTALLQKSRHSRDGAGFQSHICIQKDQNGVRGEPGEHIASVLFSTPAWGKRRGGFDAHASIRAGDRANDALVLGAWQLRLCWPRPGCE